MKKTLTINLNGSVFHIDEDAYLRLNNYLNAIDAHFPNMEDKEILRDIEARIAELFSEKLTGKTVVEIADVEDVIALLGQPSQFDDESETTDEKTKDDREKQQESKKTTRKLYRDTDNQVFGGVLAGLAAYFGFDVVWLRILLVVLVIFGFGMPILLYIIAWFIIPQAKTAAQKLEMRGEEVTVDNIKNFFESEQFRENANQIGSKFGEVFLVIVKIFLVFWGVIAIIVGFSIILAIMVAAVALFFSGQWLVFDSGIIFNAIFWLSIALLVLIPAIGIFAGGIRLLRNRRNLRKSRGTGCFGWIVLVLWIASLLALIAVVSQKENFRMHGDWKWKCEKLEEISNKINSKFGEKIIEIHCVSEPNDLDIDVDVDFGNRD